jgi:hypothetical protein
MTPSALALYVFSLILWKFPPGKHPQIETREAGAVRYAVISRALADSAIQFDDKWPEGSTDLTLAGISAFGWSMGFRKDVQTGEKRGPKGEACFSDMQAPTLRMFAQFETAGLSDKELFSKVIGLDYQSLRRCFDAGFAGLTHARKVARWKCKDAPLRGTFALYANGNFCHTPGRTWIERVRLNTYLSLQGRITAHFPAWVPPELTREGM